MDAPQDLEPYRSPEQIAPTPRQPSPTKTYEYRTLAKTTWLLTMLFAMDIAVSAVSVVATVIFIGRVESFGALNLPQPRHAGELAEMAQRVDTLSTVSVVLGAAIGIIFLTWIYGANRNAHALGAARMYYTPGWAVGLWFIPIVQLFKPYQVVKEIWLASDPSETAKGEAWKHGAMSPWIGPWWALWVIMFVGGRIAQVTMSGDADLRSAIDLLWVSIALQLVAVPAAVLSMLVVRGIQRRQEAKVVQLA